MLPKIDVPIYELKLPSDNKEVKVRPFLVKEEKLLLMAVQSNDAKEIVNTTKQVINNCLLTESVNVDALPFFDIDYLFIALRAKSVGETVTVNFICNNKVEDKECKGKFPVDIDIANVAIDKNPEISMEIKFHDDLIFKMKYPSYSLVRLLDDKADPMENKIKIIAASVERIFNKGQYFTTKDFTPEELREFIENLTHEQFKKLDEFVNNFPSFYIKAEGKCIKCGYQHSVRYKDFINFFR